MRLSFSEECFPDLPAKTATGQQVPTTSKPWLRIANGHRSNEPSALQPHSSSQKGCAGIHRLPWVQTSALEVFSKSSLRLSSCAWVCLRDGPVATRAISSVVVERIPEKQRASHSRKMQVLRRNSQGTRMLPINRIEQIVRLALRRVSSPSEFSS